ncbi:MAG: sigma-70 family RNA polymerase sigma factor [Clostridia bacterium]|nr:sigma-70 family RNA polymerase sigma factor [Clostridia bacterium]
MKKHHNEPTESNLIALEQHVTVYGPRLSRLCFSLCKNAHDAEDLYQETWLRVVRAYDRYDPSRPFAVWINRICINCYRDLCRRRRDTLAFDSTEHMDEFFASLPDADSEQRADYAALYNAMQRLSADEQAAVSLFYFDEYDGKAAAQMLGKSYSHFRLILHRAKNKLKGELET